MHPEEKIITYFFNSSSTQYDHAEEYARANPIPHQSLTRLDSKRSSNLACCINFEPTNKSVTKENTSIRRLLSLVIVNCISNKRRDHIRHFEQSMNKFLFVGLLLVSIVVFTAYSSIYNIYKHVNIELFWQMFHIFVSSLNPSEYL